MARVDIRNVKASSWLIPHLRYLCARRMKFSYAFLVLPLLLGIAGNACKDKPNGQPDIPDHVYPADSSTHSSGFENEANQYESADRVIWQKPDLVIQQLGDVEGKTVADLGAGTGYFSRRIAYKGARVIAIDIDPLAIQWMEEQKARFPIELQDRLIIRQAEPHDPRLRTNEVDMVILVNTYTYIQNRVDYFSRLKQAIRKGGTMLIIDFKKTETPFGPKLEERIDAQQVQQELKDAGYVILTSDEASLEYQYIIKAQRP
jgi:cyclopropane fatty-acyl-phospholipid synthase-like methyltransferase